MHSKTRNIKIWLSVQEKYFVLKTYGREKITKVKLETSAHSLLWKTQILHTVTTLCFVLQHTVSASEIVVSYFSLLVYKPLIPYKNFAPLLKILMLLH